MAFDSESKGRPNRGLHLYVDIEDYTFDYAGEISPLTFRVDEDATTGTATFAMCLESKVLEPGETRILRRYEGLKIAAAYLSREFGRGRDVDPEVEYLSRSVRKKFNGTLKLMDAVLKAKVFKFTDSPDYGFQPGKLEGVTSAIRNFYNGLVQANIAPALDVPSWGKEPQDLERIWSARDYEALSLLLMHDVERFFNYVNPYLDHELQVKPLKLGKKDKKKEVGSTTIHLTPEQEVQQLTERHTTSLPPGPDQASSSLDPGLSSIRQRHSSLFSSSNQGINSQPNFPRPYQLTGTRAMSELFGRTQREQTTPPDRFRSNPATSGLRTKQGGDPSSSGDSSDSESSSSDDDHRRHGRVPRVPPHRSQTNQTLGQSFPPAPREVHFDLKLKPEIIPEWDGDPDSLALWILKINALSKRSAIIFDQLGEFVPIRLRKEAETWYYSLPSDYRRHIETNWDTLKDAIGAYYMNRSWLDKQKARANRAYYRESGHTLERPSDYYIRKSQLLTLVYSLTDSEIIMEVMNNAPSGWTSILTTHLYSTVVEFQSALKFHEDALIRMGTDRHKQDNAPFFSRSFNSGKPNFRSKSTKDNKRVKAYAVGWSPNLEKPKFPRDDKTLTKRKASPEAVGARPCRHCGSPKHWDFECKYSRQGSRQVRANLANFSEIDLQALEEYEDLFYASDLDTESEDQESSDSQEQDFDQPPRD